MSSISFAYIKKEKPRSSPDLHMVSLRLDVNVFNYISEICSDAEVSRSQFIRHLISDGIESYKRDIQRDKS